MKRMLLVAFAVASVARAAHAQSTIPDFDKLRTPASPAFVVLDVSPTAIQRPTQPSTLAFALLQGLSLDEPQTAAGNFSLEVAPYWLVSHPSLTLNRYYNGSWTE